MLPAARREDEAAAAASEDDISCMQAHPHSESKLNAGTIAVAAPGCYVCQHIDLSRAHRSADADAYCVEDPSGCRG
jgi:hypothetical protein